MKLLCRLLIALMIWTPYQVATAGMIGTDQVASTTSARADIARELQAFGIDPSVARERVAALSDEEVRSLAGRLGNLPAGADASGIVVVIILLIGLWWFLRR